MFSGTASTPVDPLVKRKFVVVAPLSCNPPTKEAEPADQNENITCGVATMKFAKIHLRVIVRRLAGLGRQNFCR